MRSSVVRHKRLRGSAPLNGGTVAGKSRLSFYQEPPSDEVRALWLAHMNIGRGGKAPA